MTRILTTDLPQYFAVLTRIRQESNGIGTEGGVISSTVVPQVQAVFPEGSLTKNIKVGLQVSGCHHSIVSSQISEEMLLFVPLSLLGLQLNWSLPVCTFY